MAKNRLGYSALIRTFNSERTLPATLGSLERQTHQPSTYVFVDSGSTDGTRRLLPENSVLHKYTWAEFNYSEALNQGLDYVDSEYVLVISSHTSIDNRKSVEFAIGLLESNPELAAAYLWPADSNDLQYDIINTKNFTGFNGVFNTCAIFKVKFLKKRRFRTDVFSAEDQEWSKWLLEAEGKLIARISGGGMMYNNPQKYPLRKKLKEHLAIALFVRRDHLGWPYIARVAYRVLRIHPFPTLRERFFNLCYMFGLIYCRFGKPKFGSRYS